MLTFDSKRFDTYVKAPRTVLVDSCTGKRELISVFLMVTIEGNTVRLIRHIKGLMALINISKYGYSAVSWNISV